MDRELLIEIGCEELPASWLPGLTRQVGDALKARLAESRLAAEEAIETFSTPRRLTVCIAKLSERQTDLEELVTGPPVSAAFDASGQPTPAAAGFARKQGSEVSALEQVETPKGPYLAFRKKQRGRPAADVLPDVLAGVLRDLNFPKSMRWDAWLDDGRGELLFGRPIRWILFLYGGRVVPFEIRRSEIAQSPQVQDVRSAAVTYGHRFLTTSGRAGRAIKVRSFDDYRARLLENFVVLERSERQDRIARELEAKARKLNGRVASSLIHRSAMLEEVPDLVEYPTVMAGFVQEEFLKLPPEVLMTTLVHHQHYFPVVDEAGNLKNAFLAVTNTDSANEKIVGRNAERVVTARLRDARFFWETDRRTKLEERINRLATVLFHKKLGTYFEKTQRIAALAEWVAGSVFGQADAARDAGRAAHLSKADLVTDMVREFTELQGTIGGIYAREEGEPESVWKAIYYQYLPIGIEPDAPPTRRELGTATVSWAAVSLADKLDTLVGMFFAGERPTGSRDPFGLRRQAHGILKILLDLPSLIGNSARPTLDMLLRQAAEPFGALDSPAWDAERVSQLMSFVGERYRYVLAQRGFDPRNVEAVLQGAAFDRLSPSDALKRLQALPEFSESADFRQLAFCFKRVKNIAKELSAPDLVAMNVAANPWARLTEPAELELVSELQRRQPVIEKVLESGENYRQAFAEAAKFGPTVDRFFKEVFVMVDDLELRRARLFLMHTLESLIRKLFDPSEVVTQTES